MKQKMIFVPLISTIAALLLLTCALFGPPRLAVKPEALYQEPVLVANNQMEER